MYTYMIYMMRLGHQMKLTKTKRERQNASAISANANDKNEKMWRGMILERNLVRWPPTQHVKSYWTAAAPSRLLQRLHLGRSGVAASASPPPPPRAPCYSYHARQRA